MAMAKKLYARQLAGQFWNKFWLGLRPKDLQVAIPKIHSTYINTGIQSRNSLTGCTNTLNFNHTILFYHLSHLTIGKIHVIAPSLQTGLGNSLHCPLEHLASSISYKSTSFASSRINCLLTSVVGLDWNIIQSSVVTGRVGRRGRIVTRVWPELYRKQRWSLHFLDICVSIMGRQCPLLTWLSNDCR